MQILPLPSALGQDAGQQGTADLPAGASDSQVVTNVPYSMFTTLQGGVAIAALAECFL